MFHPPKCLSPAIITLLLAFTSATLSAAPVCQSPLSDSDNDGWGWENNQSCIVMPANAQDTNYCSSAQSDADGDGWGWENNRSCRVGNNTSTTTPSAPTPVQTPICTSGNSDIDNDGWGWENNQSCRVQNDSEPVAPVTPVVEETNSNEPQSPTPLKIMPVGDSITHGHKIVNSYREPLEKLLDSNDCRFEYVGSQQTNFLHDGYRAPHEGYSDHTADEFINGRHHEAGNNRGIAHSMSTFNPDVVLLQIGSNDMHHNHSISGTVAEIDQIVSIIHQQNSSTIVLLANVIPWYGAPQSSIATLSNEIQAYVNQLSDQRVKLVDVRSGYRRSMTISDGIHPNATGEAHIADAFFDVYERAGLCD